MIIHVLYIYIHTLPINLPYLAQPTSPYDWTQFMLYTVELEISDDIN